MRKRRRWALSGLAIALVALAAYCLSHGPERITRENYKRIREGMTRAEVEAILGPPGDYRSGLGELLLEGSHNSIWAEDEPPVPDSILDQDSEPNGKAWDSLSIYYRWFSDNAEVDLRFDDDGRVAGHSFYHRRRTYQPPLDNYVWRVKRQWRRWFPEEYPVPEP